MNPKTIRFYEETGLLALLALALLGGHDFERDPEPEPAAPGGAA